LPAVFLFFPRQYTMMIIAAIIRNKARMMISTPHHGKEESVSVATVVVGVSTENMKNRIGNILANSLQS